MATKHRQRECQTFVVNADPWRWVGNAERRNTIRQPVVCGPERACQQNSNHPAYQRRLHLEYETRKEYKPNGDFLKDTRCITKEQTLFIAPLFI